MGIVKSLVKDVIGFTAKAVIFFIILGVFTSVAYWLVLSPLFYHAYGSQTFSVQGTAKKEVEPDIAQISAGITSTSTNVADLKKSTDKAIEATIAAIVALGIDENTIKSSFSITPNYDYTNTAETTKIKNYTATAFIEVKTDDFDKVDKILESAIANGLNVVNGVSYTVEDPEAVKAEIREEAIQDAKEKAEKLAKESGLKLGKLVNVIESNYYAPIYYGAAEADLIKSSSTAPSRDVTATNPGLNEINTTVTLVYEIN